MQDDLRTRRRFLAGAGVAVALGIAGCTGSTDGGQTSTGSPAGAETEATDSHTDDGHTDDHGSGLDGPSKHATVTMATTDGGSHFEPHVVWVEQGGTVTWELDSGSHTTTAYASKSDKPQRIPDGGSAWDSGTLSEQGKSYEHTFETVGVYDYFCAPHEATGMVGTVIVGSPDPDGQPGLQPPQESLPGEAVAKIESLNQRVTGALDGSGGNHDDSTSHEKSESDS